MCMWANTIYFMTKINLLASLAFNLLKMQKISPLEIAKFFLYA